MIAILLHLILNPYSLGAVAVMALIAVGLYFTIGPVKLLQIALDIRVWFAIAGVVAVLGFAHQEKANQDLRAQLQTQTQQTTSTTDGAATTQLRVEQKTKRAAQAGHLQQVIAAAKPADAEDAVLDAIALQNGAPIAVKSVPHIPNAPAPSPKPEAKNNVPAPSQVVPDRSAVPAAGKLRKRPDVVVVP